MFMMNNENKTNKNHFYSIALTMEVYRAGLYIEFVRYIDIFFTNGLEGGDTVYINIQEFDMNASENRKGHRVSCSGESASSNLSVN